MALESKQLDPRDLIVTWGEIILDGFADGTFVTITYDNEAVVKTQGSQGFTVAMVSARDGGKITCVLSQASPINDRLSAIAALQRRKGVGLIKKPLVVTHKNGTTLAIGAEAWIMKVPDSPFADTHQNRDWAFDIAHLDAFIGGATR